MKPFSTRYCLSASILIPALALPALAQSDLPPAAVPGAPRPASKPMMMPVAKLPVGTAAEQAAMLSAEAFGVAARNASARPAAVRMAAPLLARFPASTEFAQNRDALTQSWLKLAMSSAVSRQTRLNAFDAFFESAVATDTSWARAWALRLPDAAGRAGALLRISRATQKSDWTQAENDVVAATRAARSEEDLTLRARALTFIAYRQTELSSLEQKPSIVEASSQIRLIQAPEVRNYLLAELVGAAARYDLDLARKIAADISDEGLKNLANARVNISEISQTTLTKRSGERVQALATAAAPYDQRALPVLLQLPPQPDVLKAISQTLPQIYPSAQPAMDVSRLEQMWDYSQKAPEGTYRDQLQSRLARLMVLEDLWRGRDWGKKLTWKGGRVQVGAFLNDVLAARRSRLKAGPLQDTAQSSVARALYEARKMAPTERVEALLLLAGQILG